MAPTYSALAIGLVTQAIGAILVHYHIAIGSDQLTTAATSIVDTVCQIYGLYRQIKTGRATLSGVRPATFQQV